LYRYNAFRSLHEPFIQGHVELICLEFLLISINPAVPACTLMDMGILATDKNVFSVSFPSASTQPHNTHSINFERNNSSTHFGRSSEESEDQE